MGKYNSEQVEWFLQEIASSDADEIESDELEILGESAEGVEGFFTISIRDVAESAAEEITRLRAKLAEAEGQEPVAWLIEECDSAQWLSFDKRCKYAQPLYTHPAPAKVPEVNFDDVPVSVKELTPEAAWICGYYAYREAMLKSQGGE
ncbi:hypothetical protein [Zhongshania sp.]|uniref:hypothetical protein n=1 Tax=Zhongshania sp. TaxID=1971902 RepID=UPI00356768BC